MLSLRIKIEIFVDIVYYHIIVVIFSNTKFHFQISHRIAIFTVRVFIKEIIGSKNSLFAINTLKGTIFSKNRHEIHYTC